MKNKVVLLFLISAVLFSGICWMQSRQNQKLKHELATLRQTLAERDRQKQADDALKRELTEQQEALYREVGRLAGEVQSSRGAVAGSAPSAGGKNAATAPGAAKKEEGFGALLGKMLEDPGMKKMMRDQQMAMMDSMYGPLFKELGLTSEEITKFKELIVDAQMGGVANASALFGGESDPAKREEAIRAMQAQRQAGEDQLKSLLGEDRFAQYKNYQQNLGERMTLNQFQQRLAGGQNALSEDQNTQLLAIMAEERRNAPSIYGNDPNAVPDPAQFESMFSDEKMNKHFEEQEQLNQRILDRARAVLTPEQLNSLASFQTNQLQMQRFGMSMAAKMMGGKKSADAAPVSEKP